MPKVPTRDAPIVQTEPLRAPLQGPSTVDVSGLTQGLNVAANAMFEANRQIEEIELSEANAELTRQVNNRLFNDTDAYFKLKAQAAVQEEIVRVDELTKIQQKISAGLPSGASRRLFDEAATAQFQQMRVKMGLHSYDERQNWDRSTSVANIQAQLELAANDPSLPTLRGVKVRIADETASIARINGMSKAQQDIKVAQSFSSMSRMAIEQAMIKDLSYARTLMDNDEVGGTLMSEDRRIVNEKFKDYNIREQSRLLAAEISSKYSDSLSNQLAEAKKIADTEVMDETVRRLSNAFNAKKTAEAETNSATYNEFGNMVMDGVPTDRIEDVYDEAWRNILTQSQREHLKSLEGAGTPVTDWNQWSKLSLMPTEELAKIMPMDYRQDLADTEFKQLVTMVGKAKTGKVVTNLVTPLRMFEIAIGGRDKLEDPKYQELMRKFDARIETLGPDASVEDQQRELDHLMQETVIPNTGLFWRDSPQLFEIIDPEQQFTIDDIEDIPYRDVTEITESLRNRLQREPTESEIIAMYVTYLRTLQVGE
jgi:hypothetical protein